MIPVLWVGESDQTDRLLLTWVSSGITSQCLELCMGKGTSWVGGGLMIYEVLIMVMWLRKHSNNPEDIIQGFSYFSQKNSCGEIYFIHVIEERHTNVWGDPVKFKWKKVLCFFMIKATILTCSPSPTPLPGGPSKILGWFCFLLSETKKSIFKI